MKGDHQLEQEDAHLNFTQKFLKQLCTLTVEKLCTFLVPVQTYLLFTVTVALKKKKNFSHGTHD